MLRLSSELARVSHSIAFAGAAPTSDVEHAHSKNLPVMLEAISEPRNTQTQSVPELLDMIDQAANEIHTSTGKIAEHYVSRRDFGTEDRHSLLSGSEFDEVVHDDEWPSHGLVSRQSIDEQYRTLHEMLSNAQPKSAGQQAADSVPMVQEQANSAKPRTTGEMKPAVSTQPARPANKPASNIPKILTTKPTLPATAPKKSQDVSPAQTPPPVHLSLHHAPELSDAVKKPSATPSTGTTPNLKTAHHHTLFSNLLNPFHHSKPSQPSTPTKISPSSNPNPLQHPSGSSTTAEPVKPPTPVMQAPVRQDSPEATTQQPISDHPNPYHHAPHTPLDAAYAAYGDPKVREQQQVIRAAMRMEKDKRLQDAASVAAAAEREARKKSLPDRGKGAAASSAAVRGRKGWFS
jgi:hypothetical protein